MKTSPQKRKQQSDVQAARGRLRGVLNESLTHDDGDVDDIPEDYEEEEEEVEEPPQPQPVAPVRQRGRPRKIPITQPVKTSYSPPPGTTPNKRRKRDREAAGTSGQNKIQAESFVMKLFDRTLDLSKYTEHTPLYPICRAWMANQPRNPSIRSYRETRSPSPVHRKDNAVELLTQLRKGTIKEVTSLPKPKGTDLLKLPPQKEPNKYNAKEDLMKPGDTTPEKDELMALHLGKWKSIKSDWHKHTKRFRQRNDLNFLILQELFKP